MTSSEDDLARRVNRIMQRRQVHAHFTWDEQSLSWIGGSYWRHGCSAFVEGDTLPEVMRRLADKIEEREGKAS